MASDRLEAHPHPPPTMPSNIEPAPSTPRKEYVPHRILEPSPSSFSNYFSDDEMSPPIHIHSGGLNVNGVTMSFATPATVQQALLMRVHNVAELVQRREFDDHARIAAEERLSALEMVLSQPDVQSREAADVDASGLFAGDECDGEEESGVNTQECDQEVRKSAGDEDTNSSHAVMDHQDVQERLASLAKGWKENLENLKNINRRLENHIDGLRNDIAGLRKENVELHSNLDHAKSDMRRLKKQFRSLESRASSALDNDGSHELRKALDSWKLEWNSVNGRLKSQSSVQDLANANDSDNEDFKVHVNGNGHSSLPIRSRLKMNGHDSHRGMSSFDEDEDDNESDDDVFTDDNKSSSRRPHIRFSDQPTIQADNTDLTDMSPGDLSDDSQSDSDSDAELAEAAPTPRRRRRTPWEELWDGVAALAGVREQ